MITLLFTDASLTPVGQPVTNWTAIDITLRFNQPNSATVTLPAFGPYVEMAQPGNRLVVIRDGQILTAGPVEYPGDFSWSADGDQDAEPGQLVVSATDDSVWLGRRLTYPDPAHASNAQTAAFYTNTANAEVAMRDLVDKNAGPGAVASRQVPHLVLGSLASVGGSVPVRTRLEVLSDVLRALAITGGGLGFRVREDGGQLKFEVFAPADRTATVRFSRSLGNLRSIRYQPEAPTATVAIVGGDGTGSSRTIVERPSVGAVPAPWGRIEVFVNDSSTSTTDLNQSGDAALAGAGERADLSINAVDTPLQRYGVDYQLGDLVTVELYPGVELADVVRAVHLTATPEAGEVVQPQVGTDATDSDSALAERVRELQRRVGFLEAT